LFKPDTYVRPVAESGILELVHVLILPSFLHTRDEQNFQSCVNNVHKLFKRQWDDKCQAIGEGKNCGLPDAASTQLEQWRQEMDRICTVPYKLVTGTFAEVPANIAASANNAITSNDPGILLFLYDN
jgi:hypothetical protein